jgi:hypothetical protein
MRHPHPFGFALALWLAAAAARAAEAPDPGGSAPAKSGDKELAGISIVGNDDAPKALVIVPWKSSAMGSALDISRALDDGRQAVDKDVFERELDYYRIRSESTGSGGAAN